jgi:predicted dehydrogenase
MSEHDGPRAAIIGAGLMGQWHADAVRRIGGRVTVIVDPNEAAREGLGRRHPNARLLAALDPTEIARGSNVAHVCTPLETHYEIVSALLTAGMHVLVEKPFANTAADTTSMLALAADRRLIVCPVHQFLFQDGVRRIVDWLPSLGRVRRIEFATCSAGAVPGDVGPDVLVAEILPHPLSLIATLLQSRLSDADWQVTYPAPGEFRATATLSGAIVDVAISAHGRPTENVLRVVCDAGSATADLFHGFAVRHDGTVSRTAKIARPFVTSGATLVGATANLARRVMTRESAYPGLRDLVRRFYAATRGASPPPIPAESVSDVALSRDQLLEKMRSRVSTTRS